MEVRSAAARAAEVGDCDPWRRDGEIAAVIDENFIFHDVEHEFCSAYGLGCEQVVGRGLFEVAELEDFSELVADPLGRCLRGEEVVVESWFKSSGGKRVAVRRPAFPTPGRASARAAWPWSPATSPSAAWPTRPWRSRNGATACSFSTAARVSCSWTAG